MLPANVDRNQERTKLVLLVKNGGKHGGVPIHLNAVHVKIVSLLYFKKAIIFSSCFANKAAIKTKNLAI